MQGNEKRGTFLNVKFSRIHSECGRTLLVKKDRFIAMEVSRFLPVSIANTEHDELNYCMHFKLYTSMKENQSRWKPIILVSYERKQDYQFSAASFSK